MVIKCSIFGCTHRKDRESELEYYRLPAIITNQGDECEKLSTERRRVWLANIGQNFENKNLLNVRVCSAHFVSGKKSYLHDKLSPNWAPTVNLGKKRRLSDTSRYDCMLERKRRKSEKDDTASVCDVHEIDTEPEIPETGAYIQTDINIHLMDAMQSELQELRSENTAIKARVSALETKFSLDYFRNNDEKVKHLTGLQSFSTL